MHKPFIFKFPNSIAYFIAIAFFFVSNLALAQQKKSTVASISNSIQWRKDLKAAFAQAKAQNKMLFVECYSPTCPSCQGIEPYFKLTEVVKKYNSEFIPYKLNVDIASEYSFIINSNLYLPSIPQFLFYDAQGKLVYQAEVSPSTQSLLDAASNALNPEKSAISYRSRFNTGERGLDFLIQYSIYSKLLKDTTAVLNIGNEIFKAYPEDQLGSETSWRITKKTIVDMDNGFAKYWFNNVDAAAAFEAKEGHPNGEKNTFINIIQNTLFGRDKKNLSTYKIDEIKGLMRKIGEEKYIDGATWELECLALVRENRPTEALALADRFFEKSNLQAMGVIYVTRLLASLTNIKDSEIYLSKWLNKAAKLPKDDIVNAEYYYELGKLRIAQGDKVNAKSALQTGLNFARKSKNDESKFNALLAGI